MRAPFAGSRQPEASSPMPTAFVSHSDCSRHDTGWAHPEHQGRLPALVRAVYRDLPALHGHLLDVEARPATAAELGLVHTARHVEAVRAAAARARAAGAPVALYEGMAGGPVVSAASWAAALAAGGTALTGVDAVLDGRARNAFCSARPPGGDAYADGAAGHSLFNHVALAAAHLRKRGVRRLLVAHWGGGYRGTLALLGGDAEVRLVLLPNASPAASVLPSTLHLARSPAGADGGPVLAAFESALREVMASFAPEFVLLGAGFDLLASDPSGGASLQPRDYYRLTLAVQRVADACCRGRLVSVLEGGYDPAGTGHAVVQHLRALCRLPAA